MGRNELTFIFILAVLATVVAADVLFFRHLFRARLIANIGIVLVYAAFYLAFLHNR